MLPWGYVFATFFFYMWMGFVYFSKPQEVLVMLLLTIIGTTYWYWLTHSLYLAYWLFMVYVGGLLVLVIYLVLVSSNYYLNKNISWRFMGLLSFIFLVLDYSGSFSARHKVMSATIHTYSFSNISLLLLGLLLLFLFLYLCNMVCLSGRTIRIGSAT
uniref:NADH dehydrogenase subunit 6 n=1 Tax=Praticolella mexicana TaxID=882625 RepID=A0A1J0MRI6_9EUPU|nr:NADH dehydrogenase subunit 6 [Praticolella mexicana]APD28039.1 NADH dehydrogenase subunit 6 [Praticolella mexicana]